MRYKRCKKRGKEGFQYDGTQQRSVRGTAKHFYETKMWNFLLSLYEDKRIKPCFLHTFSECANLQNSLSVTLLFLSINVYWEKKLSTLLWWKVVLVAGCCAPPWSQLGPVNNQRMISSASDVQKMAKASESWSKRFFFPVVRSRTHTSSLSSSFVAYIVPYFDYWLLQMLLLGTIVTCDWLVVVKVFEAFLRFTYICS